MEKREPIDGIGKEAALQTGTGKKELRRLALQRRNALSCEEREAASLRMTDRILGHQWFYRSEKLLLFAGFGSEIDTGMLTEEALRLGKAVYFPRVEGGEMSFYRIFSRKELVSGYRGIPEPAGDSERFLYQEEACDRVLMILPGVVFDPYHNRIGYGKGFYDRYLADKPSLRLRTIAVGFRCQMVEEIPADDTDIRPYQVLLF